MRRCGRFLRGFPGLYASAFWMAQFGQFGQQMFEAEAVQMGLKESQSAFCPFFCCRKYFECYVFGPAFESGLWDHPGETKRASRIYNGGDKQGGLLVFRRMQNHL